MSESNIINMTYKRIRIATLDGSVDLDQETSEALWMYSEVKKISIEQAIDEILKSLIKMKKENDGKSAEE